MGRILNLFYLYETRPLGAVAKLGAGWGGGETSKSFSLWLCDSKVLFLVLFYPLGFPYIAHHFQKIKPFSRLGNVSIAALRKDDRKKYGFADDVCYKRKRHNG